MKRKVLVLVPHPDDELLIAGALIYTLRKKKYDITVAYYTNGDSTASLGEVRIHEAIKALKVLGVGKEKVIFLGYGNNWRGGTHIYNLPENQQGISYAGRKETYCVKGHPEYCMLKSGEHHLYTRKNIKNDIKALILDVYAEFIICVDFDSHPDHRALSLFFEEAMAEILKSERDYKPIVLKKFAYAGMNGGKWDYYYSPVLETQLGYTSELFDQRFELDNPIYLWSERIQLEVDWRNRTRHLHNNVLYKAASKHQSQNFKNRTGKFANADMVYWQRRTDSISYCAQVSATSGEPSYVNDFKMIDCDNVLCGEEGIKKLNHCTWIPDVNDTEKKLFVDFREPVRISKLHLYESFVPGENILKVQISFDTGKIIMIDDIEHKGRKTEIVFETQYGVRHMELQIVESEGKRCGLTELEIYEDDSQQVVPLKRYKKSKRKCRNIENNIDILFEKKIYQIMPDHAKESKYFNLYQFLLKWNAAGEDCVKNWLKQRNYSNIAVYGMGDLGRKVIRDLEGEEICIRYAIDKMAGIMTAAFPVLHPNLLGDAPMVDVIIVTVIKGYNEIKGGLVSKGIEAGKINSLEEVIDEMLESDSIS